MSLLKKKMSFRLETKRCRLQAKQNDVVHRRKQNDSLLKLLSKQSRLYDQLKRHRIYT